MVYNITRYLYLPVCTCIVLHGHDVLGVEHLGKWFKIKFDSTKNHIGLILLTSVYEYCHNHMTV